MSRCFKKQRLKFSGLTEKLEVKSNHQINQPAGSFVVERSGQAVVLPREMTSGANRPSDGNDSQASGSSTPASAMPASFNPIVRLEWTTPETLYFQTAYVRLFSNEPINTFPRWHLLTLSAQAAVLK